jgi:16S rRNA (uracil1498-N3)-methyltransferase
MSTSNLCRLYINLPLIQGDVIKINKEHAHYLIKVMRKKIDDQVLFFNGIDGEWIGKINSMTKNNVLVEITVQTRKQAQGPDLWLIFAPIKGNRLQFIIEKATELGVSGLIPVITNNTVVGRVNQEKIAIHVQEAAEQCNRISVPTIGHLRKLGDILANWPEERTIIFCDETKLGEEINKALEKLEKDLPYAILIGPEGGFTEKESEQLRKLPFVISVQLGPRILRAETATIAALSCFQAVLGDWHN